MRFFISVFCSLFLLSACSDNPSDQNKSQNESALSDYSDKIFEVKIDEIPETCSLNSEIVCAIMDYIACSMKPDLDKCSNKKDLLPKFVFMKDEGLGRPTWQKFQIVKIKSLLSGDVEIYASSTCDGKWFGLCQGNVIFVLANKDGRWFVKDVYARESF